MNNFDNLPSDMTKSIYEYLHLYERARIVPQVSKAWHQASKNSYYEVLEKLFDVSVKQYKNFTFDERGSFIKLMGYDLPADIQLGFEKVNSFEKKSAGFSFDLTNEKLQIRNDTHRSEKKNHINLEIANQPEKKSPMFIKFELSAEPGYLAFQVVNFKIFNRISRIAQANLSLFYELNSKTIPNNLCYSCNNLGRVLEKISENSYLYPHGQKERQQRIIYLQINKNEKNEYGIEWETNEINSSEKFNKLTEINLSELLRWNVISETARLVENKLNQKNLHVV